MKSINFQRNKSLIRVVNEQQKVKKTKQRNWDRILYIGLLGLFLLFMIYYFSAKYIFVHAYGHVIIENTKEQILIKNKQQLMEGIKGDGNEITPSYLNDPYFKTKESAQRYSNWKDKITPNSKRKSGTPNLYINGFYHNTIEINVKGEKIITENKTTIGKKVKIELIGQAAITEDNSKEVNGKKLDDGVTRNDANAKGTFAIIEAEIYGPVNK